MKLTEKAFLNLSIISKLNPDDIETKANKFIIDNNEFKIIEDSSDDIQLIPSNTEIKHLVYFTMTHVINCIRYSYEDIYHTRDRQKIIFMMREMIENIKVMYSKNIDENEKEDFQEMITYFEEVIELLHDYYHPKYLSNRIYYFIEFAIQISREIYKYTYYDPSKDIPTNDKGTDDEDTDDEDTDDEDTDDETTTNADITNEPTKDEEVKDDTDEETKKNE